MNNPDWQNRSEPNKIGRPNSDRKPEEHRREEQNSKERSKNGFNSKEEDVSLRTPAPVKESQYLAAPSVVTNGTTDFTNNPQEKQSTSSNRLP